MIINLKIPDALYETYLLKFGSPGHYGQMKAAIEHYKDIDKSDRAITVSGEARQALEKILETTLDTPEKLVRLVKNLCTVKIGGVEVGFTQDQLERIDAQAGFMSLTREQFVQQTVETLTNQLLELS